MSLIRINKALPRREWAAVLICTFLFVLGAVIKFPDSAYRGLILTTFNFLHYPAFFILYFLIARSLRFPGILGQWGPLTASISVAILLELVQPLVSRSATWTDVFVSSAGALTAFWLVRLKTAWQSRQQQPTQAQAAGHSIHQSTNRFFLMELSAFTLSLILGCTYLLKPVYSATYILAAKHRAFPQLSAHQPPLHFLNWFPLPQGTVNTAKLTIQTCPVADEPSTADVTHCVAVTPIAKAWSGLGQVLGFDGWQDYESLEFEIFAASEFSLILRIDDTASTTNYGDRYNKEIAIKDGLNTISIPLKALRNLPHRKEPLNLAKIRKLFLFIAPTDSPAPFYVRRVFLASSSN